MSTNTQILERQPGKGIQLQLALDDAFADSDDQSFEFSSAAVRSHFAEQEYWTASSVDEPDTSISTLYLDGSTDGSKSDSVSAAQTPADQEPSHELSPVVPDEQPDRHSRSEEELVHPTVHIDVSKPPSSRVVVVAQAENGAAASDGAQCPPTPSPSPSVLDLPTMTASSSLPNTQAPVPPQQSHKSSRSAGPTIFQKVVSRTRPHFLPPKNRKEDLKHLADWEAMMKQSRAAGKPHLTRCSLLC